MRMVALCGLIIVSILSGCASTSVVPVGNTTYPPLSASESVQVFQSETEVQGEYTVLGMITHGRNATTIFQTATFSPEDLARIIHAPLSPGSLPQKKGGTSAISLQTNVFPPGIAQV